MSKPVAQPSAATEVARGAQGVPPSYDPQSQRKLVDLFAPNGVQNREMNAFLFNALENGCLPEAVKSKYYKIIPNDNATPEQVPNVVLDRMSQIGRIGQEELLVHSKCDGFNKYFTKGAEGKFEPTGLRGFLDFPVSVEGGKTVKLLDYFDGKAYVEPIVGATVKTNLREILQYVDKCKSKGLDQEFPKSDLIMYDLPQRRTIKYDPKSEKYRVYEDGKEQAFADEDTKCFGTGTKNCQETILALLDNSGNSLMTELNDATLEEGKVNIQPEIAIKILEKLGFQKVKSQGASGMITIFESVDQWKNGKGNMNEKLASYLRHLVSYVNGNPEILNHGYKVTSDASDDENLRSIGIKRFPAIPMIPTMRQGNSSIIDIAETMQQQHKLMSDPRLLTSFGVRGIPMFGGQSGGSGGVKIRALIMGLISDLERAGKKLSTKDKDMIIKNIEFLEKLEKSLTQVGQYLSEYRRWIPLIPDGNAETIGFEPIERKIEKYRKCIVEQQNLESGLIGVALQLKNKCA